MEACNPHHIVRATVRLYLDLLYFYTTTTYLAVRGRKLDQLKLSPSWLGTKGLSGNNVYCLSPMKLSSRFLNVFKVGAV